MPDLQEDIETAHDHLDRYDRLVEGVEEEPTELVSEKLTENVDEIDVDVSYFDRGNVFRVTLGLQEVLEAVDQELDDPYTVVRGAKTKFTIADSDTQLLAEIDPDGSLKDLISSIESVPWYDDGAPFDKVMSYVDVIGLSPHEAEYEIEKLKQRGEVYEPKTDHLRTA